MDLFGFLLQSSDNVIGDVNDDSFGCAYETPTFVNGDVIDVIDVS